MRYLVVFRTHIWDSGVAEMARRAAACCASGHFVVATDTTNGPLSVEPFPHIAHNSDFSAFGLPNIPAGRTLWWNADYVLYAAKEKFPDFSYYVMLEYDVLLNCDVDRIIAACTQRDIDFSAHDIKRIEANHWSRPSALEMSERPMWAFLPLMILSARAVDFLRGKRSAMARDYLEGRMTQWPYCEPFLPTALAENPVLSMANLNRFVDTELLRYRPFMSLRDPGLAKPGLVAHPVFSGQRFIYAFVSGKSDGSYLGPDGKIWPELAREDPADLRAVMAEDYDEIMGITGQPKDPAAFSDVARNKKATQSSHSRWSLGQTAEDDARRAISGVLPADFAFHTDVERDPWWCVDLLNTYLIKQVEIVNRPKFEYRFRRFRIESSDDGIAWSVRFTQADGAHVSSDPAAPAVFVMPEPFLARYVRIVLKGFESLSLRRVKIIGVLANAAGGMEKEMPAQLMDRILADPDAKKRLLDAVAATVQRDILGRKSDSYNIDALGFLAAGIEASQYAVARMAAAKRFESAEWLRDFAVSQAPETGMVLEFGVFSGQSINRMAAALPRRRLFGFDSFEGLPETWRPGFPRGAFRTDLPKVRDNVELVVGWFDQVLPDFVKSHPGEPVALLHVDCDLYSSTKTIFSLLGDRIGAGTIIIFDEYFNYPEWAQHEFKAFQEFVAERRISYEYIGLVPSHQQACVRILGAL